MAWSETFFTGSNIAIKENTPDNRNELRFVLPLKLAQAAEVCCQVLKSAQMKYSVLGPATIVCLSSAEVLHRPLRIKFALETVQNDRTEIAISLPKSAHSSFVERLVRIQQFSYLHAHIEAASLRHSSAKESLLSKAENADTHPFTLLMLSNCDVPDVRMAVADNPSSPYLALIKLACDHNADVRYALAENHNVRIDVLKQLSFDQNPYVGLRASQTLARVLNEANLQSMQHHRELEESYLHLSGTPQTSEYDFLQRSSAADLADCSGEHRI